jgi:hypothetical protein
MNINEIASHTAISWGHAVEQAEPRVGSLREHGLEEPRRGDHQVKYLQKRGRLTAIVIDSAPATATRSSAEQARVSLPFRDRPGQITPRCPFKKWLPR